MNLLIELKYSMLKDTKQSNFVVNGLTNRKEQKKKLAYSIFTECKPTIIW
ncbi:hypothetical protein [Litoribacter populi]|nr:hypothetical protein [Litoribacter populi]